MNTPIHAVVRTVVTVLVTLGVILTTGSTVNAQIPNVMTAGLRAGVVNSILNPAPIALLVPDGVDAANPAVVAWLEAAREEGISVQMLTDAAFLALGTGSNRYRGIILPDQLHSIASEAIVAAIDGYVTHGGQAMLVYDFGALDSNGSYPIPKSRFSAMAGVDYLLYDELRDRTVGLGPVIGYQSQLRTLWVPPGKSMEFVAPVAPAVTAS